MYRICIGKKTIIPVQEWNNLSPSQLEGMAYGLLRLYEMIKTGIDDNLLAQFQRELKVVFVHQLLGISGNTFKKLTARQLVDLFPITEWLFGENKLTRMIIRSFRIRGRRYYGPGDLLQHITIEELALAEKFMHQYMDARESESLNKLVAVLYRPAGKTTKPGTPGYSGDIRRPFNPHNHHHDMKRISRLGTTKKYAIAMQYLGGKDALIRSHPNIFKGTKPKGRNFGMIGVIMEMSGGRFGSFEETKKANARDFLGCLEIEAVRAREAEHQ